MLRLEELCWPQLEALDRSRTVLFVTVSPVEEHGPHLPLGTDIYTGRGFTEAIAAQLEASHPELTAVLAPTVPIGSGTAPYLGSIGTPPRLVRDVLLRMGRAFARDDFRCIVAISGHLGFSHLMAMEMAAHRISKRYGVRMMALGATLFQQVLRSQTLVDECARLPEPLTGAALKVALHAHHAGALETSLMLHLHPELVQSEFRQLVPIAPWQLVRWRGWTREHWPGYVGDPARARADLGRLVLEIAAVRGADLVVRLAAGEKLAEHQVNPLLYGAGRVARRVSLALGAASLTGMLVGLGLHLKKNGRTL